MARIDLVQRYVSEVWTFPGNPAAAGEILSRDFVRYGPTEETSAAGLGAFGAYNERVREIFPDLVCQHPIQQIVILWDGFTV